MSNDNRLNTTTKMQPEDIKEIILSVIDDAMLQKDRYVTISFLDRGTYMSVYPFEDKD